MSTPPAPCAETTLTDRYQTTVPAPVRQALGLRKGDKICYRILSDNQVVISRVSPPEEDPLLGKFLDFLAADIESHPHHVQAMGADLADRIQSLVADIDVDLDAPLDPVKE